MRSLIRGIQWILWFPFAAASHPVTFFGVIGYCWFYEPAAAGLSIIAMLFLCGTAYIVAQRLRPASLMPKPKLPKRERPLKPGLAKMLIRSSGTTSAAAAARRLPRELKAILAAPADAPPEAVLHEQRLARSPAPTQHAA